VDAVGGKNPRIKGKEQELMHSIQSRIGGRRCANTHELAHHNHHWMTLWRLAQCKKIVITSYIIITSYS